MKPTSPDKLSCSIFGHNFYKQEQPNLLTTRLVCKHCGTTVKPDLHGDFQTAVTSNRDIQNTIRQLFLLTRRQPRQRAS